MAPQTGLGLRAGGGAPDRRLGVRLGALAAAVSGYSPRARGTGGEASRVDPVGASPASGPAAVRRVADAAGVSRKGGARRGSSVVFGGIGTRYRSCAGWSSGQMIRWCRAYASRVEAVADDLLVRVCSDEGARG